MTILARRPWLRPTSSARFLGLLLTACSDPPPPTPTGPDHFDAARRQLLSTDADRGAVTVVAVDAARAEEVVVGVEPARITAVDADTVLVTLRGQRELVVLERADAAAGWAVARRIATGAEPIGVAVDAARTQVYVAASHADQVEVYDLADGARVRTIAVPGHPRSVALHGNGAWMYVGTEQRGVFAVELEDGLPTPIVIPHLTEGPGGTTLVSRVTGDVALSPDHARLSIPAAFVDQFTPLGGGGAAAAYGASPIGPRLQPAVVDVPLDGGGAPTDPISCTPVITDVDLPYIANIAYDGQGDNLWVTFDGHDQVVGMPGPPELRADRSGSLFTVASAGMLGGRAAPAPSGELFLTSHLERGVRRIDLRAAGRPVERLVDRAPAPLSDEALRGRAMFFTAQPGPMTGGVLSCATCHFEGRADGVTWRFEHGPRQTPSLAERVRERAPLRWSGDRASIAEDTLFTAQAMGGAGLTAADADAVEAYVVTIRGVDLPLHGADDAELRRGAEVFERAGCAGCHAGALRTDRQRHGLGIRDPLQTPSLLGVAATAPYMVDGRVPDLATVVARADEMGHGATAALAPVERAALVRYLESL